MKTNDYHSTIHAAVSPETAYKAISEVNKWWTQSVKGKAEKNGDTFLIDWGKTTVDFKIEDAVPNKSITWLVTDCNLENFEDKKEWKNTKIVWDLTPSGNSTQVDMTHVGLVPESLCYENCKQGWNFFTLKSLQALLDTGMGRPDTPHAER
jgi:Activator of Hsp90 ATPase homolog 1-like protein